jgi:hypothetical protein
MFLNGFSFYDNDFVLNGSDISTNAKRIRALPQRNFYYRFQIGRCKSYPVLKFPAIITTTQANFYQA